MLLSLLLTAESAFVSLLTLTRSQATYLGLIEVELGSFREQEFPEKEAVSVEFI